MCQYIEIQVNEAASIVRIPHVPAEFDDNFIIYLCNVALDKTRESRAPRSRDYHPRRKILCGKFFKVGLLSSAMRFHGVCTRCTINPQISR